MKNRFLTLLFLAAGPVALGQFRYAPDRPQVGQPVSFTYTPQGTPLASDSTLEGRFVRYGAPATMHLSLPATLTLVRQGTSFVGQLYLPKKDIAGLMLFFRNSQQPRRIDLNKGQLYAIPIYDATGRPAPHAIGGQASVFSRTNFLYEAGSRPDSDRVIQLYEQELAQYPELYPLYWADYVAAQIRQKKPGYGPKVKTAIDSYLASRPVPATTDLADGIRLYESMGDFKNAGLLRERQKTIEPAGLVAQKDRSIAVRNEGDWTRKKTAYQAFAREFPASAYLPALSVMMMDGYYKNNDIRGLMTLVEQLPPAHIDVLMLNTIAFQLADEGRNLPEAEQLIRRALALLKTQSRPGSVTAANWPAEQPNRQRQLTNTLARALEQQGKHAEAYAAYQTFVNPDDLENTDKRTIERYFMCALRTSHATEARPIVETAVQLGQATPRLKAALTDWYASQPGHNKAKADAYLADLEADLRAELRDEIRQKLINLPAPAFSMTDLQGRTIASSACRGKVVVLDFWATWCGPCIASFPAMQQAQTHFQGDPNVRFLFVNTREGGPVQRVYDFMDRHDYPFVVPLDEGQRVAKAYGVQGIPTKVVIDPNGRIRYRSIGYNGNAEATVNELTMVIEMLREGL